MLQPFLKWAGGKRWLASRYLHFFPTYSGSYFEPFLGSGAVFFALRPTKAVLADLNEELIQTYGAISAGWRPVERALRYHEKRHSKDHYYRVRRSDPRDPAKRAARFVYLNRTCWNGLYRVNRNGQFNVPKGTKRRVIFDTDDFEAVGRLLSGASLLTQDFENVIDRADKGDLVFADPPYTVLHSRNGFIKYNERLFSWADQIRLRDVLVRAKRRGVKVIVTNADHPLVRQLYRSEFDLCSVPRASVLAADSRYRTQCTELIIRG
jgi:DNA adenine methylase